jgi:hypothetical protein
MPAVAPLQVLLFRDLRDLDCFPFEESIARALQGGKEAGGYLATGDDLGVQLEAFSTTPKNGVEITLDSFCHTVSVILIDQKLLDEGEESFWDWLAACWKHTRASLGRHALIAVAMDERVGRRFTQKRPEFQTLQLLQGHDLGERAIRPAIFALRLLHECRLVLARALPVDRGFNRENLRLFISHAKMDALPLAHALRHQIGALQWLHRFYDVDDIPAGSEWQAELEKGVGSSLIIMLRTEGYDSRYWCQQEVLWSDEYATPAVLVDARTGLNHPAANLPFDRAPTVRIPDGNLIRILFLALREGLRFVHFARRVEELKNSGDLPTPVELRVFSLQPSMAALLRACHSLAASKSPAAVPRMILYPDPPFRSGPYEAAHALVDTYLPRGLLLTPNTLAATKGGAP